MDALRASVSLSFNNTLPNNSLTKGITKGKWMDGNGVFIPQEKEKEIMGMWESGPEKMPWEAQKFWKFWNPL